MTLPRSLLFVPGNRPSMLSKSLASGADALLPDMEDSVPDAEKTNARQTVREFLPRLAESNALVIPRVNSLGSGLAEEDLAAVVGPHIDGISIGKITSAADSPCPHWRARRCAPVPRPRRASGRGPRRGIGSDRGSRSVRRPRARPGQADPVARNHARHRRSPRDLPGQRQNPRRRIRRRRLHERPRRRAPRRSFPIAFKYRLLKIFLSVE